MSEPLIFATTFSVNEGQLPRLQELSQRFIDIARTCDGVIAYQFHVSDDGRELSNVQFHVDAASMDAYLPLVEDNILAAVQLSKPVSIDVYGTPGPLLREVLRHNTELGVRVQVKPSHLGGFTQVAAS